MSTKNKTKKVTFCATRPKLSASHFKFVWLTTYVTFHVPGMCIVGAVTIGARCNTIRAVSTAVTERKQTDM